MLRVKVLNLQDVYLELQTLYKRSIDVYQQSLELIQSIMTGSNVKFICKRVQSIQFEATKFHFEILRDGETRGESSMKISDLYSRSLIRKEQAGNAGPEFTLFINLFRHLKNTLEIFKSCWAHGFDIEKNFLSKEIRIENNDLTQIEQNYFNLRNYFEDLSKFVEAMRFRPEYFFMNYLSGQQIRSINKNNLMGIFHYLKWWEDFENQSEEENFYSMDSFGIKEAADSKEYDAIEISNAKFKEEVSHIEREYKEIVRNNKTVDWSQLKYKERVETLKNYLKFLRLKGDFKMYGYLNRQKFDKLDKILVVRTQNYFKALISLYNETSTPRPKLHQVKSFSFYN